MPPSGRIGGLRDRLAVPVLCLVWLAVLAFGAGIAAVWWLFGVLHWG